MNNTKVSVYLITKNRLNFLKKAVESVLNQSHKYIELLIVDDASSDGTKEYLKNVSNKDKRIKVFFNSKSEGACFSRNKAIGNSTGKYITGLDDDDYFLPKRIELFLENYDSNYSFISSGWKVEPATFKSLLSHIVIYKYGVINLDMMMDMNHIGNQIFVEKSRLCNIGMFDVEQKAWQDYDLWVRLIKQYGPALKIRNRTQVMNVDNSRIRITNGNNKVNGITLFYEKNKNYMNDKQKSGVEKLLRKANEM